MYPFFVQLLFVLRLALVCLELVISFLLYNNTIAGASGVMGYLYEKYTLTLHFTNVTFSVLSRLRRYIFLLCK